MMDFFDAVRARRSIRRYAPTPVPEEVVERALDAALLAPNSSNMQTWGFYWVRTTEKKAKLVEACLSQGAARTARELVVVTAEPRRWRRHRREMLRILTEAKAPSFAFDYYGKLIPLVYGWQFFSPVKWLILNAIGLFRPISRRPWSPRDRMEVSVKSAALACENFMLAIAAQGFHTCPMEGFDEVRVRKILGLSCSDRVVMVISVGAADPAGVWGPQVRFDRSWFVHRI